MITILRKDAPSATREILDGAIFFLSLVDEGANLAEPLLKDKNVQRIPAIAKMDREGLLHTLVYGPNSPDAHGDIAGPAAVKKIAHSFIPNMVGSGIDVMHNCKPVNKDQAHVCETFMIQKNGDDRFKGVTLNGEVINDTTKLAGWWAAVLKINDPQLRKPFEDGAWRGVSMYGPALVRPLENFTTKLAQRLQPESTMDETKLAEILAKALQPLTARLEKIEASSDSTPSPARPPEVQEPEVPAFDGDPNCLEDLAAHEELVMRSRLDFSNPKDIQKWRDYLKKRDADKDSVDGDELAKAKAEKAALEKRISELSKGSKQSTEDSTQTDETPEARMDRIRKSSKSVAQEVAGTAKAS